MLIYMILDVLGDLQQLNYVGNKKKITTITQETEFLRWQKNQIFKSSYKNVPPTTSVTNNGE